jgi:diacylglycerol O-acyltransferase / wax synthase
MATIHDPQQAPHKPLHVGDMEAAMWGIENDPLLRQTMTAVLVLDRPPDREVLLERLERASRTLPPFRHRLVEVPLRLSTPRWLVDPNFDLSYHVRWIRAPGYGSIDGVLEFARQSTMSGLDRARPLWTVTVVEGLEGDQAAVILKISHVVTDGVGTLAVLALLGDPTREPRDLGVMPAIPAPESESPVELAGEAVTNAGRRTLGFVGRSTKSAARAVPAVVLRPVDTVSNVTKNVRALVKVLTPSLKSLSPLMTQRRGWMRFAALQFDLETLRKAAKSQGCTVNDAFVTAVAQGFARYHQRHGKPVERLRAVVAVNIRKPGDFSFGNQVRGESIALPVGADDPAGAMAIYHGVLKELKEQVRLPLVTGLDAVFGALSPAMGFLLGVMMKHDDFAVSNIPADDEAVYLARAKIVGLYPFGPLMGTAASCALVGYNHRAFVGINADAAAVPDLDILAGCLREGFEAVIALADVS